MLMPTSTRVTDTTTVPLWPPPRGRKKFLPLSDILLVCQGLRGNGVPSGGGRTCSARKPSFVSTKRLISTMTSILSIMRLITESITNWFRVCSPRRAGAPASRGWYLGAKSNSLSATMISLREPSSVAATLYSNQVAPCGAFTHNAASSLFHWSWKPVVSSSRPIFSYFWTRARTLAKTGELRSSSAAAAASSPAPGASSRARSCPRQASASKTRSSAFRIL
mmetsp:Transcript_55534/g.148758  ORF Transcript_55534/g.148758 Transcript_55534/m.148758 type:complete len:222 (-) Transcript_55534:105-770(-)